jgi:hypothetical protein
LDTFCGIRNIKKSEITEITTLITCLLKFFSCDYKEV